MVADGRSPSPSSVDLSQQPLFGQAAQQQQSGQATQQQFGTPARLIRARWAPVAVPVIGIANRKPSASSTAALVAKRVCVWVAAVALLLSLLSWLLAGEGEGRQPQQPQHLWHQQQAGRPLGCSRSRGKGPAPRGATPPGSVWRRPALLLLGDSLTERGGDGGWASKLAAAFNRKADVLNRGYSGYTTQHLLLLLPELLEQLAAQRVLLCVVLISTNDASLPASNYGRKSHVPVDTARANLLSIVQQLVAAGPRVLLLTPPPVNDDAIAANARGEEALLHHSNAATLPYVEAVRSVAASLGGVPLLDIWQLFQKAQPDFKALLSPDGLHLSLPGQQLLFEQLMARITQEFPDLRPHAMPFHHPNWRDLAEGAAQQAQQFEAEADAAAASDCGG